MTMMMVLATDLVKYCINVIVDMFEIVGIAIADNQAYIFYIKKLV